MYAVCALPCVAHGKAFAVCNMGFAVCPRHTENYSIPVVIGRIAIYHARNKLYLGI